MRVMVPLVILLYKLESLVILWVKWKIEGQNAQFWGPRTIMHDLDSKILEKNHVKVSILRQSTECEPE